MIIYVAPNKNKATWKMYVKMQEKSEQNRVEIVL